MLPAQLSSHPDKNVTSVAKMQMVAKIETVMRPFEKTK